MESTNESNLSNTGKTRNEWWRKRKEEPRKIRCKVEYKAMQLRVRNKVARPKSNRYQAGLRIVLAKKRLADMLKRVAKKANRDANESADKAMYRGKVREQYIVKLVKERLAAASARIESHYAD